jgi:hypothetical protein
LLNLFKVLGLQSNMTRSGCLMVLDLATKYGAWGT